MPELGLGIESPNLVLIVEDDALVRRATAGALRAAGLTVIEAANADEAWQYIRSGGQVDIVFSDIHMAGSMNGVDLARRVKTAYPALPVILTSGNISAASIADVAPFVPKPYRFSFVVSYLLHALKQ